MKQKRLLFVILTCMVAVVCLIHMNRSYDPLSRYPYELSESQHSAVLNALSSDEIEYIIEYAISPDEYLRYLNCRYFNIYRVQEYSYMRTTFPTVSNQDAVSYIYYLENKHPAQSMSDFSEYYVHELVRYYDDYPNALPVLAEADALDTAVDGTHSVGYYSPKDLISVSNPYGNDFELRREAAEAYQQMIQALNSAPGKEEEIKVTQGYLSYQDIKEIDPTYTGGTSDYQLGLSVVFDSSSAFSETAVYHWLSEHAYEYGFIQYNAMEPYHFRYIGKDNAAALKQKGEYFCN